MSDSDELTGKGWEVGLTSRSKRGKYRFVIYKDGVAKAETPRTVAFPEAEDAYDEGNAILGARYQEGYDAGELAYLESKDRLSRAHAEVVSGITSERDELDQRCRGLTETLEERKQLLNRAKDRIEVLERDLRHARQHRWLALAAGVILGAAAYAAVLRFGADYLPLF